MAFNYRSAPLPDLSRYKESGNIYGSVWKFVYFPASNLWQCDHPTLAAANIARSFLQNFIWNNRWLESTPSGPYNPTYDIVNIILLCLEFKVDESRLISELIRAIFEIEGKFALIWIGIGNKDIQEKWEHCVSLFGIQQWSFQSIPDYHLIILEYLIKHSAKCKSTYMLKINRNNGTSHQLSLMFLDYPIFGSSSIDVSQPIIYCMKKALPKKLRLILRYGASVQPHSFSERSTDIIVDTTLSVAICVRMLPTLLNDMRCRMTDCILLLLAEVPYYCTLRERLYDILSTRFLKGDDVKRQRFPSLLEISRFVIRRRLCECEQLPDGIKGLQIPESLKEYLDLLSVGSHTLVNKTNNFETFMNAEIAKQTGERASKQK